MKLIEKVVKWVVTVPAVLAGVALVALMLVTVVDVFLRAFFSTAVMGSNEISVAIMICAGFLGMAWCALNGSHIKVDLLVGRLPLQVQRHFFKFNYLLVAVMSTIIAVQSYFGAMDVKKLNSQSQLLEIPQYPFYMIVSFSYLLLALTVLVLLIKSFFAGDGESTGRSESH